MEDSKKTPLKVEDLEVKFSSWVKANDVKDLFVILMYL